MVGPQRDVRDVGQRPQDGQRSGHVCLESRVGREQLPTGVLVDDEQARRVDREALRQDRIGAGCFELAAGKPSPGVPEDARRERARQQREARPDDQDEPTMPVDQPAKCRQAHGRAGA
jgi:hypothetical protein